MGNLTKMAPKMGNLTKIRLLVDNIRLVEGNEAQGSQQQHRCIG